MLPLYKALQGKAAEDAVAWLEEMLKVFSDAKRTKLTMMAHPCLGAPTTLTTNASHNAVGAVNH